MQITFLQTQRITEDGFKLRICNKDETYDIADTAARDCIAKGWAFEPRMRPEAALPFLEFLVHKSSASPEAGVEAMVAYQEYKRTLRVPTNPSTFDVMGKPL